MDAGYRDNPHDSTEQLPSCFVMEAVLVALPAAVSGISSYDGGGGGSGVYDPQLGTPVIPHVRCVESQQSRSSIVLRCYPSLPPLSRVSLCLFTFLHCPTPRSPFHCVRLSHVLFSCVCLSLSVPFPSSVPHTGNPRSRTSAGYCFIISRLRLK